MDDIETPTDGKHYPRGRPFSKGNPGRRPGSKNKATLIASALLADEAEQLTRTAIELAKAGDKDMLKFLLGRVLPKDRTIRLELPSVDSTADAAAALAAVTNAISKGEITPSEGAALCLLLKSRFSVLDDVEIEERVYQLEARSR